MTHNNNSCPITTYCCTGVQVEADLDLSPRKRRIYRSTTRLLNDTAEIVLRNVYRDDPQKNTKKKKRR